MALSWAQTVVLCAGCCTVLHQPTGGKARPTEGCIFKGKQYQKTLIYNWFEPTSGCLWVWRSPCGHVSIRGKATQIPHFQQFWTWLIFTEEMDMCFRDTSRFRRLFFLPRICSRISQHRDLLHKCPKGEYFRTNCLPSVWSWTYYTDVFDSMDFKFKYNKSLNYCLYIYGFTTL